MDSKKIKKTYMKTAFKQPDGTVKWKVYQDLPNAKGERTVDSRTMYYDKNDFKGKTVLDIGCWGGQMMLEAKKWGASDVLGVEIDRDAIKLGRELGLEIMRDDIENPFLWRNIKKFDVGLCLAILGNMKDKVAVLSKISSKVDVLYVEGHGRQHLFSKADWMDLFLRYTDFKTIEYLGDVETRPFFRLSNEEKSLDYIKKHNRIALIGKPGAGKTYLTQFFKDHKIYSDVTKGIEGDRYVVDSHGALTLAEFDCVVDVKSDRKTRLERLKGREKIPVSEFNDTVSPLYIKGAYNYYSIVNE